MISKKLYATNIGKVTKDQHKSMFQVNNSFYIFDWIENYALSLIN